MVPRSVLARHYTDSSPERLKRIYDGAGLRVRKTFSNVIVVINKTDLLDEQRVREVQELCKAAIFISIATGQGVPELEKIEI